MRRDKEPSWTGRAGRVVLSPAPKWLLIVRRDLEVLYADLRHAFAKSPAVEVILDRRRGERRRSTAAMDLDRRRGDRRWPMSPSETALWETVGVRLVLKTPEVVLYDGPE